MPLTARIGPAAERVRRRGQRAGPRAITAPAGVPPGQLRAADRAGVGLGVEPAVGRVVVLGLARRAHREPGHRRGRPVVRHAEHDRVPRSAVGAVGERVPVAAVGRVVDLGQARRRTWRCRRSPGRSARPVGRSRRCGTRTRRPSARPVRPRRRPTRAKRRRVVHEQAGQLGDPRLAALDVDQHAALSRCGRSRPARARPRGGTRRAGSPTPWTVPVTRRTVRVIRSRPRAAPHRLSRSAGAGRRRACRRCGCRRRR